MRTLYQEGHAASPQCVWLFAMVMATPHTGILRRLWCNPVVNSDQTKSNTHGVFPDQNYRVWDLIRVRNSMISGHFVWSEVTSVWGWNDQRSLRFGDGVIRGHFGLGMVWSEVTSGWEWSDQRRIQAHISLIRDHFVRSFFFWFCCFFTERSWLCHEATKNSILVTNTYTVWWFWSESKRSST